MTDRTTPEPTSSRGFAARFWADRSGATAIEYGLIASCIVVVIIASLTAYGDQINAQWNWISDTVLANVRSN